MYQVGSGRASEASVRLETEPVQIESVTVKAKESYFEKDPQAEVSGRTIDTQEIMNAAGSFLDIQRVVQVLPSVVSGSDQMNEIIVRGGNYGENLFVMDGIEIPNPNHFAIQGAGGGPISLLRAEFIQDVSFMAGAFPAKYGDKASSVMDITMRRGSREHYLTNIDMSMAGIGTMVEGPVGGDGSFLFSARKSYLDFIISNTGMSAIPNYYNLQSKVTYTIGGRHTLLWNTVYGDDSIRIEPGDNVDDDDDEHIVQKTDMAVTGLTVKSVITPNVLGEGVLSYVRNNWETDVWEEGRTRSESYYSNRSVESETNLKYDLTWFIGRHELSGGFSVKNSWFDHDIFAEEDTVFTYDTSFATARQDTITGIYRIYPAWRDQKNVDTTKSAAYAQLRLNPVDRLTLRLGGRYDRIEYTGDMNYSPRLGARYMLRDNLSLNAAYGVHYQSPAYIVLSSNDTNKHLDNYRTEQYVLGTEWLPKPELRVTLEGYSKRYRDVPVEKGRTTPDPWDYYEGEYVNGAKGHSEGIELYVHRKMSTSFMYILSYSRYRAFFEDPRTGKERPWDFDHKNVFTLNVEKRWDLRGVGWFEDMRTTKWYRIFWWILPFGDEMMLSGKWRYAGGHPTTTPAYLRENHNWIMPSDTDYNSSRVPDYHRLDLRLDQRFYFKNWNMVMFIDIMNVYNRENVWDYSRDEYGKVKEVHQYSTMPVGGFNIEF